MSRTTRYTALGLASLGLVGGSLIGPGAAFAQPPRGDRNEVSGSDCLRSSHDRECWSRTSLDADQFNTRSRSEWRTVRLSADVDFFKWSDRRDNRGDENRNPGDNRNRGDDNFNRDRGRSRDLGDVEFQFRTGRHGDWRTFATRNVDRDGEADITVRVRVRSHTQVTVRAEYSGVRGDIRGSTSNTVDIGSSRDHQH